VLRGFGVHDSDPVLVAQGELRVTLLLPGAIDVDDKAIMEKIYKYINRDKMKMADIDGSGTVDENDYNTFLSEYEREFPENIRKTLPRPKKEILSVEVSDELYEHIKAKKKEYGLRLSFEEEQPISLENAEEIRRVSSGSNKID